MSTASHRGHQPERTVRSKSVPPVPRAAARRENWRRHGKPALAVALAASVATGALVAAETKAPARLVHAIRHSLDESNAYSDWSLDNDKRDPKRVQEAGQGILSVVHMTFTNVNRSQETAVASYVEKHLPKQKDGRVIVYRGEELDIPVPEGAILADPNDAKHLLPPRGHGPDSQSPDQPGN